MNAFFVLRRPIGSHAWACILVTHDFGAADKRSESARAKHPRLIAHESSVVHASALTRAEIEKYRAQADHA